MPTSHLTLPIALDAMGGDNAPEAIIRGAYQALLRHPGLKFLLFGNEQAIQPLLTKLPKLEQAAKIVHTDMFVAMDAKPSQALRRGKGTSMWMAIDAVKQGQAFGVVSAGNTGALMAMSKMLLKTLPGISRPAIAALFPTVKGECVILDLGANIENTPQDLFYFAVMGNAFARAVLGLNRPKIGLLNVGAEDIKGHEGLKQAAKLLTNTPIGLDFRGFVEGNHIPMGDVDVVVTDGFTGNVALKMAEGTARLIRTYIRGAFTAGPISRLAAWLASAQLRGVKHKLDERKRNGAMFVGLGGIAVKSHGSADAFSFCNAISVTVELAAHNINEKIITEMHKLSDMDLTDTLKDKA